MTDVFLGLGSNIDRDQSLSSALSALQKQFGTISTSNVFETEAVGFEGPRFYNLVVKLSTDAPLEELAKIVRGIEISHGRAKGDKKFAPRTLDIDILLYGDIITDAEKDGIEIPRSDICKYAFVLEPLAEIAPSQTHPKTGKTFAELWREFDACDIDQQKVNPAWNIFNVNALED